MYADLVCKGGGMKGIALIGAICCLEDYGYTFKRLAGTSAGAIISSLVAVGYSGEELKKIGYSLNYNLFSDKSLLQSIPYIGQFASLFITKGIHKGDSIENFLSDLYKAKGKTKFKDISINGESSLKIIASDITRKKLIILPDDLVDYGIDPMEYEISKAVRMSLSIPFYFNPVILENTKCETNSYCKSFITDGALVSNFPIWVFDTNSSPRWPTFGLNLSDKSDDSICIKSKKFFPYMLDVIETSLSQNDDSYLSDKDLVRIINIPSLGVKTTNFNISENKISELYDSGYNSTREFVQKWSFRNYLERYR